MPSLLKYKSGSSRLNKSDQAVIGEEPLDAWFRKMGYNPEDSSEMDDILKIINSNPKMAFCFQHLKRHVRPTLEAQKMKKIHLYKILKNSDSNFDISKQYAVKGKVDLDKSIKFEKATSRIRALESIKFAERMNEMKQLEAKVELLHKDHKELSSGLYDKCEIIFNLKQLHSLLYQSKTDLQSITVLETTLQGKKPGSVDFKNFVNEYFGEVGMEEKNGSFKIPFTYNRLKSLINKVKDIEVELKSLNLIEIVKSIELENPLKESVDKMNLKLFLSNLFDKYERVLDLLGNSIACISTFINEVESRNLEISKQLSNIKSKSDEMILMSIDIIDNPQRKVNEYKLSKKNDIQSLMGEKNFLLAESILSKWGTSFESPSLIPIMKNKYQEIEFYRSLKMENNGEGSKNLFSAILIAESIDSVLKELLDKLNHCSLAIDGKPKDINKLESKVFELMTEMSFVKIKDVPLPEIIYQIKLTITELDRLMHIDF